MNLSVNQDISSIDAQRIMPRPLLYCSGVSPSYKARRQKLKNLLSALFIYREELLEALQDDLGKPTLETEVVEFHPTIAELGLRHGIFVNGWMSDWFPPHLVF